VQALNKHRCTQASHGYEPAARRAWFDQKLPWDWEEMGAIIHELHSQSVPQTGGGRPCFLVLGHPSNQIGRMDWSALLSNDLALQEFSVTCC
jgi:hypothetical protein